MNKVILMGRLTKNPEVTYSSKENPTAIARYTLAVDRMFKKDGNKSADFINCVAFGKNAEFAEKYFRQGTKIAIVGRWETGSYTNRDGQTIYTNQCVIETQEFAESKNASQQSQNTKNLPPRMPDDMNGFMDVPDGAGNELPFN